MSNSKIKQIAYISLAAGKFHESILTDILEKANERNKEFGISGFLTTDGTRFFQLIEGPEESIDNLYRNICRDRRHDHVTTLYEGFADKRLLPNWHMHWEQFEGIDKGISEIVLEHAKGIDIQIDASKLMSVCKALRFPK